MREINCREITDTVARLCIEANYYLGEDALVAPHLIVELILRGSNPLV